MNCPKCGEKISAVKFLLTGKYVCAKCKWKERNIKLSLFFRFIAFFIALCPWLVVVDSFRLGVLFTTIGAAVIGGATALALNFVALYSYLQKNR